MNSQPDSPNDLSAELGLDLLKRVEEFQAQIDLLREQLTESQRLATIGTIAAVIAHEFNNLLTPICSYTQYALKTIDEGKPDMELIRKALAKASQSSDKAGRICTSMLGLARGETTAGELLVQDLIDETLLVMARDPSKDGVALRVQVEPGLKVRGDAVQLQQVLLNLLINARQAMMSAGSGGSLTIKASPVPEAGEVKLQVIDTGPGISEKHIDRIFEPFFTTKGTAAKGEPRGTGLGLAICQEIVESHNGRITASSEPGKGTTFTICLPGV